MLVKPVAGWIADKFDQHKLVFLISLFCTGAGYFCLQFISEIHPDLSSHLDCSNPYSLLKICRSQADVDLLRPQLQDSCPLQCELTCSLHYQPEICSAFNIDQCTPHSTIHFSIITNLSKHEPSFISNCLYLTVDEVMSDDDNSVVKPSCQKKTEVECQAQCHDEHLHTFIRQDSVFSSSMFWIFFILNIISYSGMCVVNSIGDAIAFTQLGDNPGGYGNQRVWGSIGWGLFTIIAGTYQNYSN